MVFVDEIIPYWNTALAPGSPPVKVTAAPVPLTTLAGVPRTAYVEVNSGAALLNWKSPKSGLFLSLLQSTLEKGT